MSAAAQVRILPDHILSAILAVAKKQSGQQRLAFRGHDYMLQEIFHDLSLRPDFSLVQEFVFSNSGPIPYSPTLNDAVSRDCPELR